MVSMIDVPFIDGLDWFFTCMPEKDESPGQTYADFHMSEYETKLR